MSDNETEGPPVDEVDHSKSTETTTPDTNEPDTNEPDTNETVESDPSRKPPFTHTRASGYWAAVVVGLVVLLILVIFILENGQRASVSFFGTHGHLPQGVALLLAAVIGGLFVVFAGMARILQLRSRAHQQTKESRANSRQRATQKEPTEPTN